MRIIKLVKSPFVFVYKMIRGQYNRPQVAESQSEQSKNLEPKQDGCFLEQIENTAPRRCTNILQSDLSITRSPESWVDIAVSEFIREGVCVIKTDAEMAKGWREAMSFDGHVGNNRPSWDWAGNPIVPYSTPIKTATPDSNLLSALKRLFSSDTFEAFFQGIMGCPATAVNCRLVQSIPHEGEGTGPQSWHVDGAPLGVLRGVFYLVDVDEDSGPFEYKGGDGEINTVLGKCGDCLIFDAQRLEHRALPPRSRFRTAIDIIFIPRLPGKTFDVMHAGMNHWPADPFFFDVPEQKFDDYKTLGLSSMKGIY